MDDIVNRSDDSACAHSAAHRKPNHPLDALTADEILAVTRAIHAHSEFGTDVLFETGRVVRAGEIGSQRI